MPSLQVRDLPEHIYNRIVQLAETEKRSITQETIVLLEKALEMGENRKKCRDAIFNNILDGINQDLTPDALDPVLLIREDRER